MLFQLPTESRIKRELQPANNWGWQEILLNKTAFWLEVLAWQKTKDAQRRNPTKVPKLFVPDFMINLEATKAINRESVAQDVDSIKEILSRPRR